MSAVSADDEEWRVLLMPGLNPGQRASIKSFTLPDPKTGRPQGFLLANGSLYEVNRFKQTYSSWMIGERLLADGGMFLATPYDLLFALLPLLDRGRDKSEASPAGKYKELDELLYDSTAPGFSELLAACREDASLASPSAAPSAAAEPQAQAEDGTAAPQRQAAGPLTPSLEQQLACICDIQRLEDMCYYRLNEDRVLAWLHCKFRQARAALSAQVAGMDDGHAVGYVLAFLMEYVGEPWIERLGKRLGVSEKDAAGAILQPTDASNTATAVPRQPSAALAGPPEKKQKVDPRAAAKQASLAKQAVGTKKLTSFFTKK